MPIVWRTWYIYSLSFSVSPLDIFFSISSVRVCVCEFVLDDMLIWCQLMLEYIAIKIRNLLRSHLYRITNQHYHMSPRPPLHRVAGWVSVCGILPAIWCTLCGSLSRISFFFYCIAILSQSMNKWIFTVGRYAPIYFRRSCAMSILNAFELRTKTNNNKFVELSSIRKFANRKWMELFFIRWWLMTTAAGSGKETGDPLCQTKLKVLQSEIA